MTMSLRAAAGCAVAAAFVVIVGWWVQRERAVPSPWQGYADADFVKVGPTQAGLLTRVSVSRGDQVAAGAPLFSQDDTPDRAAVQQSGQELRQAEEQLNNLESAGRLTEIRQAEANLQDARATLARTQSDYQRGQGLRKGGVMSAQNLDQLRNAYLSATARVRAGEAALTQLRGPVGRDREIRAQAAAVDAARSALRIAQWRLAQRHVNAPASARVADVLARPGETVAAGAPVVSLLPPENMLVRFFVPETDLPAIHRGDAVRLGCDSCPRDLAATVSFVSPQAEYSPPVIYSESSRAKLVYLIEARPRPAQANLLNPGQPVEVWLQAGAKP